MQQLSPSRLLLRADPDYELRDDDPMQFRLTYEGKLLGAGNGGGRAAHKHEIRKAFHRQLKRYWEVEPYLSNAVLSGRDGKKKPIRPLRDHLAEQYARLGYNFIPLVTPELRLICSVDVLFLRPSLPGQIMKSGDIDNRIKTLFDALRMPESKDELGGFEAPDDGETPFYCLMTDDKLIAHVSIETDMLLQPTEDTAGDNDARLVIQVKLRPFDMAWDNINFG